MVWVSERPERTSSSRALSRLVESLPVSSIQLDVRPQPRGIVAPRARSASAGARGSYSF